MTQEQKDFILALLKQLNINPANPDAAKTVEMVQGIIKLLTE